MRKVSAFVLRAFPASMLRLTCLARCVLAAAASAASADEGNVQNGTALEQRTHLGRYGFIVSRW